MLEYKIDEQLPSLNDYINRLKSPQGRVMGARFKREVDELCMSYIMPHVKKIAEYCIYGKKKVRLKEFECDVKKIDEDVKKLLEEDQSLHLNLDWDGFETRGESNE